MSLDAQTLRNSLIECARQADILTIAQRFGTLKRVVASEYAGPWPAGGASFLPHLADAVPTYVETVTVVAHCDDAGRIGARELGRRLAARGFEVLLHEGA